MHNSSLWTGGEVPAPRQRGPGAREPQSTQVFDIRVERLPDRPVVARVIGPIDLLTAPALRLCVEAHITDPNGLVLDFSRVDFLAASGITVLADAQVTAVRESLNWVRVATTRPVLRPIELLAMRTDLPIASSLPQALATVSRAVTGCPR